MPLTALTGSASGIGAATHAALRAEGHDVLGIDVAGADITADLSTPQGREKAVGSVLERSGGVLDRLVLCAGLGPHVEPAERITAVNYFGALALLDGLFPALARGAEPAAAVVSSVSSTQLSWEQNPLAAAFAEHDETAVGPLLENAGEHAGQLAYAGSKNALTVAVRERAVEWGSNGVRINTVAPGVVRTPLLRDGMADERYGQAIRDFVAPIGRSAEPEEIASMIQYLIGPTAGFIHGAQFVVDGGVDAMNRPTVF